jgi:hypothetical protein
MSSRLARQVRCTLAIAVAGLIAAVPSFARAADPPTTGASSTPSSASSSEAASAPAGEPANVPRGGGDEGLGPESAPSVTLLSGEAGWKLAFFGWAEADAIYDTTQSFTDSVTNSTISRPNTIAGDNPRFQGSVRDSRIGLKAAAPTFEGMKATALMEADFFGLPSTAATQDQYYNASIIRLRQFYTKLETPVVDVLAGQTNDLFGWGGQGFFPSTPAFLGVLGEVFHRNPQLRLSKTLGGSSAKLELAVAGVRPADRDSALPDLQAGIRLSLPGWQGASAQGPRRASAAPMAIGISAVGRRLAVADFSTVPGDLHVVYAGGAAADVFIPIIPAHGSDLSNALSLVGEFSWGTGIADLYLNLTGGVLFPSLPNPHNTLPAPTYTPNIDNGIATYDANGALHTIDWQAFMVGANYHLPPRHGTMFWISGTYSQNYSDNAVAVTPSLGQTYVWNKGRYWDATVWWDITPAFQMALSCQTMTQTFGDGVNATNRRGEASWWMFF